MHDPWFPKIVKSVLQRIYQSVSPENEIRSWWPRWTPALDWSEATRQITAATLGDGKVNSSPSLDIEYGTEVWTCEPTLCPLMVIHFTDHPRETNSWHQMNQIRKEIWESPSTAQRNANQLETYVKEYSPKSKLCTSIRYCMTATIAFCTKFFTFSSRTNRLSGWWGQAASSSR